MTVLNNPRPKVAIVTGGGSGIGAATAALLAATGHVAVVVDVNEAGIQSVVQGIRDAGGAGRRPGRRRGQLGGCQPGGAGDGGATR